MTPTAELGQPDADELSDNEKLLLGETEQAKDRQIALLRSKPIGRLLWMFAGPAMLANFFSAVTNATETSIQKKVIGNIGISATAIVQPLELMLTMYTSLGLSGGVVSFISPALGSHDLRTAQKYLMHFMLWYFVLVALVPLCTVPWLRQLVVLLGAPEGTQMAELAYQYGVVIFSVGTIFYFVNYGFGNILRAASRSVFNAAKQVVTGLVQLALIYLSYKYIVAKGHVQMYTNALSQVVANALCAVVVMLLFIPFKKGCLKKHLGQFRLKFSAKGWKRIDCRAFVQIAYYAIPDWLAQFQIPIIIMVGNQILSAISRSYAEAEQFITTLGVVYKMSPLIQITNQTFSYAFGPVFGYQLGARNWGRCRETMRLTFLWQTGLSFVFWVFLNLVVEPLSLALTEGYQPMADDLSFGFRCYNMTMPLMAGFLCSNDINQCEQKPLKAFVVQVSRLVFVVFFEVVLGLGWGDQRGVYVAFVCADVLSGIIGVLNFVERYRVYGQLMRSEITPEQAGIVEVAGQTKRRGFGLRKMVVFKQNENLLESATSQQEAVAVVPTKHAVTQ